MAPTVVDNKVLIGTNGGEYGMRGFVKAFNADDGKLLWTFYTIPEKGHEGVWAVNDADRPQHEARHRGREGALAKDSFVLPDARRRRVDEPVGRPEGAHGLVRRRQSVARPVRRRAARATTSTPTRWSRSNLDKGTYKCHFQYIAHDVWDLDAVSPPILVDVKDKAGKTIPGVMHGGKTGPRLRARPQGLLADPLLRGDDPAGEHVGAAHAGGRAHAAGRERRRRVERRWPSTPKKRLAIALNLHQPMTYHVETAKYPGGSKLWLGGAFKVIPSEKQWGRVAAVNVDTGKVAWKFDTEQPLIGGGLATAGGLYFFGEGNGSFNALDSATGKKLWSFNCGAGANAMPVSYMVKGKQYIAMGCGGNTQLDFKRGNSVFVFAL